VEEWQQGDTLLRMNIRKNPPSIAHILRTTIARIHLSMHSQDLVWLRRFPSGINLQTLYPRNVLLSLTIASAAQRVEWRMSSKSEISLHIFASMSLPIYMLHFSRIVNSSIRLRPSHSRAHQFPDFPCYCTGMHGNCLKIAGPCPSLSHLFPTC
jgi:hypothetical protein